jgi:hypothetical protein
MLTFTTYILIMSIGTDTFTVQDIESLSACNTLGNEIRAKNYYFNSNWVKYSCYLVLKALPKNTK